nr:DDE-type integrase/transposase/recombinase [Metamycoplasma hominis]
MKEAFIECKGRFGRERLSLFLKKKYQIDINPRTLGRIMNKLGLLCEIRRSKRKREIKNVNATFKNLANRDYDSQMNDIYATDVTYIPSPTDVIENHVYLSVLLHHKTKKIVSWNLSKYNDTNLVLKHFKLTKFLKKFIIHSDHGYQYSSKEFLDYIDSINDTISMSRVGNSLDNREVEYFFSILKTEIFSNFFQKAKSLTFNELQTEIDKFINWYNNKRFIKKIDLKTPQQMWDVYMNNKSIWV